MNEKPDWREQAIAHITKRFSGLEGLAEEWRGSCLLAGIHPPHHNGWGALTMIMKARGLIEDTGKMRGSDDPTSHGRRQPIWKVKSI